MTKLTNPTPLFLNARGSLLDGGTIHIGIAHGDPEAQPIALFWDRDRTVPAAQPLRTIGGVIVNGAAPAFVFFAEDDYSMRVRDADGGLVSYVASTALEAPAFQPLDPELSAIAALATTAFGRQLLTLANAAALKAAADIPDCIPKTGGPVGGDLIRVGGGAHLYHQSGAYGAGRVFGPEYTVDPTTQPGDVWFKPNG